PARAVRERDAPDLERLARGHEQRQLGVDPGVLAAKRRVADAVTALPVLERGLHRLERERPVAPRLTVATVDVLAPLVANEILVPAGEAVVAGVSAPRVAGAGLGDDRAVFAGADHVDPRTRRVRPGYHELRAVLREVSILRAEAVLHRAGFLHAGSAGGTECDIRASRRARSGIEADDHPAESEVVAGDSFSG